MRLDECQISSAVSTMLRSNSIGYREFLHAEHCGYGDLY
jgi:hypothetical protein